MENQKITANLSRDLGSSMRLKEYCFEQEITIAEAMNRIEEGKIIARVIDDRIVILESPQIDLSQSEKIYGTQLDRVEELMSHAVKTIAEWDKKLQTETLTESNEKSSDKDKIIKKLRHDLEDLTILNKTLLSMDKL